MMETKFNFNSSPCTSIEQSKRLLALGLKKETADMVHYFSQSLAQDWTIVPLDVGEKAKYIENVEIPAWSLHRLIAMMPKCVRAHSTGDDSPRMHPYVPKLDYQGVTICNIDETLADFYQHTDLFDNIIDCIEWLIKEGHFNKEYLV